LADPTCLSPPMAPMLVGSFGSDPCRLFLFSPLYEGRGFHILFPPLSSWGWRGVFFFSPVTGLGRNPQRSSPSGWVKEGFPCFFSWWPSFSCSALLVFGLFTLIQSPLEFCDFFLFWLPSPPKIEDGHFFHLSFFFWRSFGWILQLLRRPFL